jgi:hypothetical protein
VPWAECDDAQRLDVHNGLLLSALWDAAFDTGSPDLSDAARTRLGIGRVPPTCETPTTPT